MNCKKCGAVIADKALICYKCGTATVEAKYQPVPLRPKRKGPSPILVVIVIALLLLAVLYYMRLVG